MLQNSYLQVKRVLIEWNCKKEANFHVYAMHSSGKEEHSSNSYEKFSKLAKYIFLIYNFICSINKDKTVVQIKTKQVGVYWKLVSPIFSTHSNYTTLSISSTRNLVRIERQPYCWIRICRDLLRTYCRHGLTNTEVSTHHPFNNIVKCWGKFS